jgi:hypothetical protein
MDDAHSVVCPRASPLATEGSLPHCAPQLVKPLSRAVCLLLDHPLECSRRGLPSRRTLTWQTCYNGQQP